MIMRFSLLTAAVLTGLSSALLTPVLQAAPIPARVTLGGHQSPLVSLSKPLGQTAHSQTLSLAISLPLRNQAAMTQLVHDLYDPSSPQYHHFLTPATFAARFSPTQADYNAVVAFAKSQGLTVIGTHPTRTLVDVSGPASAVEAAFGVMLNQYESPAGRVFHAPAGAPSVPAEFAGRITGVVGLDNAVLRQPSVQFKKPSALVPGAEVEPGTGVYGGLTPSDIRTAYNLNTPGLDGAGQTLAVYELDSYTRTDVVRYERAYHLPIVPLENILVDADDPSFPSTPGKGTGEVVLDIDLQSALAPKAAKILVYMSPNTDQGAIDNYQQIADDDRATSISTSWGLWEDLVTLSTVLAEGESFVQMALQGQTIYTASGDYGGIDPYTLNFVVQDPSSQPFVCSVGGTSLTVKSPGKDLTYLSETTWNPTGNPFNGASGGGVSVYQPIPYYQVIAAALADPNAFVDTNFRNVPDVSLDSDPNTGYSIYVTDPTYGPGFELTGGTSAAAPLWAGFTALVNQTRAKAGKGPIGFINPALYSLYADSNGNVLSSYATDFHDIADGSSNFPYPALQGYDDATGLGTFNGVNLLNDLVKK